MRLRRGLRTCHASYWAGGFVTMALPSSRLRCSSDPSFTGGERSHSAQADYRRR